MEILVTIAVLLALGTVGMRITKNVIHVGVILIIGFVIWTYVSPYFFAEGTSIPEAADSMNEAFKEQAMKDMDKNTRSVGERLSKSVTDDLNKHFDAIEEKDGIAAWNVDDAEKKEALANVAVKAEVALKTDATKPPSPLRRFMERMGTIIKDIFSWEKKQ